MKRFVLLFSLLLCLTTVAQKRKPLPGKAMIGNLVAERDEVKITNMQTGEKTTTTPGGFFTVNVKKGDTLMFKGVEIITRKMVITAFDMDEETLVIDLDPVGTQLAEVKVDGNKINSEALGIPVGKKYTPQERRLAQGQTSKEQRDPDKAYTAVATDRYLNKLSGREDQLKKEAEVEKKLMWKQRLLERYERVYFTDTLKVPNSHVDGFLYYSVDDQKFLKALETDNKEQIELQLGVLATNYRKTLKSEKN
ncbi:hypothetical protein HUK80_12360 [Flavobacterium sp. MAH-1]|uniref:CarboxypepD_reg-like domain-containing protein n=1 Tax=Flavobacterium agri TaxID=2743471 RepID=A0A7Y9C7V1_9FLAO|nr:hypothetical protein [Flavobacterium agri]NUY81693.1 hypothetical protein [Flavobacterium agri]NYA71717.1 hypothetical protein [Flavobacterium agri]